MTSVSEATAIAVLSATELLRRYRTTELSPVEATRAVLAQIDRHNPRVNAYCLVDHDRALEQAKASERRWRQGKPTGRLDGVPVAIKDVFLTHGWPTLRGSRAIDPEQPWEEDAPAVARLRANGAVLIGKTTTPELGWKGVTDSPLTGVTRNPWDPALTAGGSSGGSAVAVVLGMAPLALGTDGGGSIRIPAAFSGLVGHKPTYGRVAQWPPSPFGSLAHAGPMAWTVVDAALMLDVIAAPDPRDWSAAPAENLSYLDELAGGVVGLRVAFSPTLGYVQVDPEVAAAVQQAAKTFEALGAQVEQADPGFEDPVGIFEVLWYAGAAKAVERLGERALPVLDPGLREISDIGRTYSAMDYLEAESRRAKLGGHLGQFHQRFDLLLTPTLPVPAFVAGQEVPDGWPGRRWMSWTPFTYPFNLTQQPAASVPCGFTAAGLPIGLQIVGAKYADALVLRAAHAYQTAQPGTDRRPS